MTVPPLVRTRTRPIRVGVDGDAFRSVRTGVGRYAGELLAAAARAGGDQVRFDLTLFQEPGDGDLDALTAAGVAARHRPFTRHYHLATWLGAPLPFELVAPGRDVMLFPNYWARPTWSIPRATIVYDLSYLYVPETVDPRFIRRLRRIAPRAITHSDAVIAISHTVAGEITREFPDSAGKVRVITPGPSPTLMVPPPADLRARLAALGLEPGYVLAVGTLEPRKNTAALVEAVRRMPPGTRLVLAGHAGWSSDGIHRAVDSAGDRVRWLRYPVDGDLGTLFAGAAAVALASRYEGFGLPVLEAMSLGVPVACSDLPVLREVAGEAAAYFDHTDPDSIAAALAALLGDPDLRARLAAAGIQQARRYAWERSGADLVDLVTGLAGRER